ncbi:MAG: L-2-hydroxyglutarate oxidase [Planctomycetota bacterium]|nr:L-2-hydroxyglutarate oxidase [Planctomycetota bacterium]
MPLNADCLIIGGGIIGLATAYQFQQAFPGKRVRVLEKEPQLATHQSGHNSGVLHSGIYYRPGSLRAINCRAGKLAMERFCAEQGIDYEICGKVIVAISEAELPGLERIYQRGIANGVRCELIEPARLREIEPHATGIRAIHVPEAGIVNYRQVSQRLAELVRSAGGEIQCNAKVIAVHVDRSPLVIDTTAGSFSAESLVTCAGLQADRVARLTGDDTAARIVPFRGEYYALRPEARHLCRNLIYPVPDPNFPFLGVHFTRMIGGQVECGPNAVLALAREGYRKRDIACRDLWESLSYPGFLRLAGKHWRAGLSEIWRSVSKRAFVTALQRLVPAVQAEDLSPAPAGVRAQALLQDGSLVDDFLIERRGRILNVWNAPSPAATASLNIGRLIVEQLKMD